MLLRPLTCCACGILMLLFLLYPLSLRMKFPKKPSSICLRYFNHFTRFTEMVNYVKILVVKLLPTQAPFTHHL